MPDPTFLTLAEVVEIHADQIRRYGGQAGVRDLGLLQSAIAQPEASFGGAWLHADRFEMAAAYAYHICQNHPFFDGNKRAALASALIFLELNGVPLTDSKGRLHRTMLQVAKGRLTKGELAAVFRELAPRRR